MLCPYCGEELYMNDFMVIHGGQLIREDNGNVYNVISYTCSKCGKTFHTKTLVAKITDNEMKVALNNHTFFKTVEYEVGCRATGYYQGKIEVPYNMKTSDIEELVKEKEDVSGDVNVYDF